MQKKLHVRDYQLILLIVYQMDQMELFIKKQSVISNLLSYPSESQKKSGTRVYFQSFKPRGV